MYVLPPELPASEACKDLLKCLLVADPAKRISLERILAHPWFLENLPPGALSMNDHYLGKTPNLSHEVCLLFTPRTPATGPASFAVSSSTDPSCYEWGL